MWLCDYRTSTASRRENSKWLYPSAVPPPPNLPLPPPPSPPPPPPPSPSAEAAAAADHSINSSQLRFVATGLCAPCGRQPGGFPVGALSLPSRGWSGPSRPLQPSESASVRVSVSACQCQCRCQFHSQNVNTSLCPGGDANTASSRRCPDHNRDSFRVPVIPA